MPKNVESIDRCSFLFVSGPIVYTWIFGVETQAKQRYLYAASNCRTWVTAGSFQGRQRVSQILKGLEWEVTGKFWKTAVVFILVSNALYIKNYPKFPLPSHNHPFRAWDTIIFHPGKLPTVTHALHSLATPKITSWRCYLAWVSTTKIHVYTTYPCGLSLCLI